MGVLAFDEDIRTPEVSDILREMAREELNATWSQHVCSDEYTAIR